MSTRKVEISSRTIIFTVFFILGLWFIYQIRSILVLLFIAFILMTAINPIVRITRKVKIPVLLTVLVVYVLVISLLASVVASLLPALIQQSKELIEQLPGLIYQLNNNGFLHFDQALLSSQFGSVPSNLLKVAAGAFSNIINVLVIFFMTYYLLLDRPNLHTYLVSLFGDGNAERKAEKMISELEKKIGNWVRGQLSLMLIIGIVTYIGLFLLNVPYALPLAILAGLLELVPNIGPIIAAIPAILVGLTVSPVTATGVFAFTVLIQQLENNFLVPRIMQRAVGVKPLVTIVVLFTGFTLAGAIGAILSMPLYLTLAIVVDHLN